MANQLSKKDIKNLLIETFNPFAKAIQSDFKKTDKRFDAMDSRFDAMDSRFDAMDSRFDKFELKVTKIDFDLHRVKQDVEWMKKNSSELFTKLDKFISLYERQAQEMALMNAHIKRLEERIIFLEKNTQSSA